MSSRLNTGMQYVTGTEGRDQMESVGQQEKSSSPSCLFTSRVAGNSSSLSAPYPLNVREAEIIQKIW